MARFLLPVALLVLTSAAYGAENYGFRYSATDLSSASATKTLLRKIERTAERHCEDTVDAESARGACEDEVVNDIVGQIGNTRLTKYAARKR